MKNALELLTKAEAQITALRSLLTANPDAFAHWDACSAYPLHCAILQFHPRDLPDAREVREESAIVVARLFGGRWEKHHDGSWHGTAEVGGTRCTVVLHDVVITDKRAATVIDL